MGDAPFGFTAPMIYDIENDGSQELIVGIMSDGSAYTVEGHVLVFENSGTTASPQYQLPDDGGYSYTRLQVAGQPLTLEAST